MTSFSANNKSYSFYYLHVYRYRRLKPVRLKKKKKLAQGDIRILYQSWDKNSKVSL